MELDKDEVFKEKWLELQKAIHDVSLERKLWFENVNKQIKAKEGINFIEQEVVETKKEVDNNEFEISYCDGKKPCGFPIELADIVIACLSTAEHLGYNLLEYILTKHQYNLVRQYEKKG